MPISEKKLAANRANAKKSTGPRTPRRNSAPVAIDYATLAQVILIEGESRSRFIKFGKALEAEFRPENTTEQLLVATMVVARWRMSRQWAIESAGIAYEQRNQPETELREAPSTRSMLAMRSLADHSRHPAIIGAQEAHLDLQYHRALARLTGIRAKKRILPDEPTDLPQTKGPAQ